MNVKEEWKSKGFIDEPVDESLDLKQEIRRLCRERTLSSWPTTIRCRRYRT